MTYNPAAITAYFDALGAGEWERFDRTLGDRVSLAMHTALLERYVRPGHRILDVGAGPGRFTEMLHRLGARVVVADLSGRQLELNREAARARGFASSVEAWHQLDICDLGVFDATSFDGVVAFGGPFSYVFERRDKALAECVRVLRPGGYLVAVEYVGPNRFQWTPRQCELINGVLARLNRCFLRGGERPVFSPPPIPELLAVDPSAVTEEARFKEDLDADSLDLVEFVMALEERFDISVPEEDLDGVDTVGQALTLVLGKLGANA